MTPEKVAMHDPCCSSHNRALTCQQYRRTHFVEVRPCCATDALVYEGEAVVGLSCGCTCHEVGQLCLEHPKCCPAAWIEQRHIRPGQTD